jgi:hypothetical protein
VGFSFQEQKMEKTLLLTRRLREHCKTHCAFDGDEGDESYRQVLENVAVNNPELHDELTQWRWIDIKDYLDEHFI